MEDRSYFELNIHGLNYLNLKKKHSKSNFFIGILYSLMHDSSGHDVKEVHID